MAIAELIGSFSLGFFLGIGAALFYLRWKMKRQLGNLEQQMEGMMELGDEMGEMMPDEDLDSEEE